MGSSAVQVSFSSLSLLTIVCLVSAAIRAVGDHISNSEVDNGKRTVSGRVRYSIPLTITKKFVVFFA